MKRHHLRAVISLVVFSPLLVCCFTSAAQAASSPLVVAGLGKATVPLDGTWQFHLGDDAAWASPLLDDSGWESISVDRPWGEQQHFNYTGYAWYRRHINFVPVAGANVDLALTLPFVEGAYTLYWNGRELGTVGKMPPHAVWYFSQITPRSFAIGKPQPGVLAIRVWLAPYTSFGSGLDGGLTGPPVAGSTDAIAAYNSRLNYRWLRDNQYEFGLEFLYGLVALLGFLSWLRNRGQAVVFWMAIFAAAHMTQFFLTDFHLPLSFNFSIGWLQPVLSLQDISLWFLLLHLLELTGNLRLWRVVRILAVISITTCSLDGLLSAFDWSKHTGLFQAADFALTMIFTVLELMPLVIILFAVRKRLRLAQWLVASSAALLQLYFVVRVAAEQGSRFTHWTWQEKMLAPLFAVNGNPFTVETIMATLLLIAVLYAVYDYSGEQSERQATLEQEYHSAQELQRVLIPEMLPTLRGFATTSAYLPAQEVGGDFFQLIPKPDGSALLILGDVSGKGLKAAMTVSLIVGAVHTLAETMNDPAEILEALNRRLFGRLKNGFATCLILRLGPHGECLASNAGHLPPFLNKEEVTMPGSLPLGVVSSVRYEKTTIKLAVGDRLTVYTDGLLEARRASGEIFGFARLKELIASGPDATRALETAVAFGQQDDITVLTLTRLATGVESTVTIKVPQLVATAV